MENFTKNISKFVISAIAGMVAFTSCITPVNVDAGVYNKEPSTAGIFTGVGSNLGSNITSSIVSCMSRGGIFAVLEDYSQNAVDSEKKIAEYLSAYDDVAIAKVTNYVNVRAKRGENNRVVGKLYDKSMGTILKSSKGWFKIKSGNVVGWVKDDYVVTGNAARKLAPKVGTRIANVKTTTLRVRKKATTNSPTLTMVPDGEKLHIVKEAKDWLKVEIDDDIKGWIAKEFVDISTEFTKAETIEEELARIQREQAERVVTVDNRVVSPNNRNNRNNYSNNGRNNSLSRKSISYQLPSSGYGKGVDIANTALRYVGNRYKYGGNSLTNGIDCSGFVKAIYGKFGVSLPRTSYGQRSAGKLVCNGWDPSKVKAGDIICYGGHVAISLGGSKIVHASNRKTGIKVSSRANYRRVVCVRRIF